MKDKEIQRFFASTGFLTWFLGLKAAAQGADTFPTQSGNWDPTSLRRRAQARPEPYSNPTSLGGSCKLRLVM